MVPDSASPRYWFPHRHVGRGDHRRGRGAVGHAVGSTVGRRRAPAGAAGRGPISWAHGAGRL